MRSLFLASVCAACSATSFCDADGWAKVWADEFDGTALDNSSWTIDTGAGDSRVRNSQGTVANVWVKDGQLTLRSQRQKAGKWNFTSGAVQTQNKRFWGGGGAVTRACVRAKLPGGEGSPYGGGQGIWPAHWMMPNTKACWPSNGEIDVMEMINGDGTTHSTYHWRRTEIGGCGDKDKDGNPSAHPALGTSASDRHDASEWHEYAVEYSHEHISFAFDGAVIKTLTNESAASNHPQPAGQKAEFFDVPYYMILNTAVGGPWPGEPDDRTVFPTYHHIDYVRVAQPKA